MIYVLIVVLYGTAINFQEFSSKTSCEAALQVLSDWHIVNGFAVDGRAWCVPK